LFAVALSGLDRGAFIEVGDIGGVGGGGCDTLCETGLLSKKGWGSDALCEMDSLSKKGGGIDDLCDTGRVSKKWKSLIESSSRSDLPIVRID
jgi:hypothetical protein